LEGVHKGDLGLFFKHTHEKSGAAGGDTSLTCAEGLAAEPFIHAEGADVAFFS